MAMNDNEKTSVIMTCDIVRDLMPLVADGVASEDSERAVARHLQTCRECRELWDKTQASRPPVPAPISTAEEKKILTYLRRRYALFGALLIMIGASAGVMMIDSDLQFHNFILMPLVGALGYLCFKRKALLLPVAVFLMCVVVKPVLYTLCERNELRLRWQSGEYGNSPISRFALLQTEKKCPFRVDQNPYFRRFSTFTIGYLS